MMTFRRSLLASAVAFALVAPLTAQADETRVVATFSILGDLVERIGGEHVDVTTLVGPDGDAHVYQPTPADARAVSEAEVLIVNGLEFEGWLDRLIEASGFKGAPVIATAGIEPIAFEDGHDDHDDDHEGHGHDDHGHGEKHAGKDDHHGHDHGEKHAGHDDHHGHDHGEKHAGKDDHHGHDHGEKHAGHDDHDDHGGHAGHDHGAFDPHAWQSVANAVKYVDNIAAALAKADPSNASAFYANRTAYVAELQALEAEVRAAVNALPEDRRTVITSHDAFGYFAASYGLAFEAPQGLSTESEASAKDVARLIEQIREENVAAVFVESITDNRLIEQIARETGARVGGTLYSDALSGADGPASTYLDMIRHNTATLAQALGS